MKDTDHFLTGVPFTPAVNGSCMEHSGCVSRDVDSGHRQKTGMGWSDPTFGGFQPPKGFVGSLQPTRSLRRDSRGEGEYVCY
jgi:hypothetical protein